MTDLRIIAASFHFQFSKKWFKITGGIVTQKLGILWQENFMSEKEI